MTLKKREKKNIDKIYFESIKKTRFWKVSKFRSFEYLEKIIIDIWMSTVLSIINSSSRNENKSNDFMYYIISHDMRKVCFSTDVIAKNFWKIVIFI